MYKGKEETDREERVIEREREKGERGREKRVERKERV